MLQTMKDRIGSKRLRAPSPAMIVALSALFVALGSGAYAAITLPTNSVSTKQIKNGAVTSAKIANNAITSAKVKDGSLLPADLAPGSLPSPNPSVLRSSSSGSVSSGSIVASCHAGEYATGGGLSVWGAGSSGAVITDDAPEGPGNTGPPGEGQVATGWRGTAQSSTGPITVVVWVMCAKGSPEGLVARP